MQIFDTHCHYNLEPLYSGKASYFSDRQINELGAKNWQEHWQKSQENGVKKTLIAGADLISSQRAVEIAQTYPNLFTSVGLHPMDGVKTDTKKRQTEFAVIEQLATQKNVIAIGETGLDYFHLSQKEAEANQKTQQEIFKLHIKLANQVKKPLIIHARDKADSSQAYQEILKILKSNYQFQKPFVLHCVSGPKDYIQEMLKLGAYISFAGNVTYPNASEITQLIPLIPKNKILIETDAPFLPPQQHRGQINQPYMIKEIAQFMQNQFKIGAEQLFTNSNQFFGL